MSRSLGAKALHKKHHKERDCESEGRKMFAEGLPCPSDMGAKGKAYAMAKGWKRAAEEARNARAAAQGGQP
jgi:hypothetical protein